MLDTSRRDAILSRLIGFGGAVNTGFKTDHTDDAVVNALANLDCEDASAILEDLEKEKFMVSPNCAHCKHKCGNTSDFDMTKFYDTTTDILMAKEEIIEKLLQIGKKLSKEGYEGSKTPLPEEIYQAFTFLGYDLGIDSYANLLEKLEKF